MLQNLMFFTALNICTYVNLFHGLMRQLEYQLQDFTTFTFISNKMVCTIATLSAHYIIQYKEAILCQKGMTFNMMSQCNSVCVIQRFDTHGMHPGAQYEPTLLMH